LKKGGLERCQRIILDADMQEQKAVGKSYEAEENRPLLPTIKGTLA
jgi:hypothetical protein